VQSMRFLLCASIFLVTLYFAEICAKGEYTQGLTDINKIRHTNAAAAAPNQVEHSTNFEERLWTCVAGRCVSTTLNSWGRKESNIHQDCKDVRDCLGSISFGKPEVRHLISNELSIKGFRVNNLNRSAMRIIDRSKLNKNERKWDCKKGKCVQIYYRRNKLKEKRTKRKCKKRFDCVENKIKFCSRGRCLILRGKKTKRTKKRCQRNYECH